MCILEIAILNRSDDVHWNQFLRFRNQEDQIMGTFSKDLQTLVSPKFDENVLADILQKMYLIKNVFITNITFNTDSKKGDSYLSTVNRFTVKATGTCNRNGETRDIVLPVISKALPNNIARRKTFRSLDFFENEVIFYSKVWAALNEFQKSKTSLSVFNILPRYISGFTDGIHDYVILEDLSFKGYVGIERTKGLDLNHTQLIMRLFARFQALSLAFKYQQPKEFEEIANSLQETYFSEKFRKWYLPFQTKMVFPVIRDAVEKQLPPSYLAKLDKILESDFYGTLIRHCKDRGQFAVITHGDVWIPNFLVKYDSDKKTPLDGFMIDFQLARCASLALDITFFLYSCTDQALCHEHWDYLIEDYHRTFIQSLEQLGTPTNLLTLDDVKAEIKKHAVAGVGMSMEAVVMSLLEDNETVDLDTIQGDQEVPLETVWVLQPFKSEEKRQRIADMLKHAFDSGFI